MERTQALGLPSSAEEEERHNIWKAYQEDYAVIVTNVKDEEQRLVKLQDLRKNYQDAYPDFAGMWKTEVVHTTKTTKQKKDEVVVCTGAGKPAPPSSFNWFGLGGKQEGKRRLVWEAYKDERADIIKNVKGNDKRLAILQTLRKNYQESYPEFADMWNT